MKADQNIVVAHTQAKNRLAYDLDEELRFTSELFRNQFMEKVSFYFYTGCIWQPTKKNMNSDHETDVFSHKNFSRNEKKINLQWNTIQK